jgi:hypothetical protein
MSNNGLLKLFALKRENASKMTNKKGKNILRY